jgi:sugar transferase (PEP-CTERM/EpsH1 system associated)
MMSRGVSMRERKVHVLHVVDSLRVGGLENGVVNLINALEEENFHSSICCLKETGDLQKRLRSGRVEVFQMHQRPGEHLFKRMAALVRHQKADVVHSNNWGTFFDSVLAAHLGGASLMVHCIHGLFADDLDRMKWRRRFLQRLLALGTHRLYAVAEYLRRYYIREVGISPGKIATIYNGVDTGRYAPLDGRQRAALRSRLGFSEDHILIGSVGTLYWIKDPETLLTAAAEVLRRSSQAIFLWVGDGQLRESLRHRAERMGLSHRVRYLGRRDDVADILAALDIFVLPSIAEGLSYSILEAMATGLPVVTTRVGGNPELVRDGREGLLISPRQPQQLAEALVILADRPQLRRHMGASGRRRVEERFSLMDMVQRYQKMYLSVLSSPGHGLQTAPL